jgi:hypothetical protein
MTPPVPPRRPRSPAIDLSHIRAGSVTRVNGRLPATASIAALGIGASAAAQLTPAAARLTKADLEALRTNEAASAGRLGLNVTDINSIKAAFADPIHIGGIGVGPRAPGGGPQAISVSCCCCTPCCCAATEMAPMHRLA